MLLVSSEEGTLNHCHILYQALLGFMPSDHHVLHYTCMLPSTFGLVRRSGRVLLVDVAYRTFLPFAQLQVHSLMNLPRTEESSFSCVRLCDERIPRDHVVAIRTPKNTAICA